MPPATRDPEENADLAERLASAKDRIKRAREAELQDIQLLSDEELAEKLVKSVRSLREGHDDSLIYSLRQALSEKREMTLEDLLEMTNRQVPITKTGVPCEGRAPEPEQPALPPK